MDHSWRPRPPFQGNICPTCSISHFPFCPPHFSFTENPRFQSHNDHFFSRPPFDPFLDHRGPNVNFHRPFVGNPNYELGDRRPWSRNPSLDRDPYGQFHGQSQFGDSPLVNELYRDGLGPPSYDHSGVGFKRMRVDERGSSSFMGENHVNSLRTLWEDERRLKLIRDHGSVPSGSLQGGADLVFGFNRETKGYMQEDSVLTRSFSNVDNGEHGKFDELGGFRNSTKLKPSSTFEMNDLQDPGIGYFDRKETSFHTESDFNLSKYKEEFGLTFGQQYMESNKKEEVEQSQYGQVENSLAHSLHMNGHSSHPDRYTDVEQAQRSRVEATLYNEGGNKYNSNLYNEGGNPYNSNTLSWKGGMKQPPFVSQNVHYPNFDTPNENYLKHDPQRIHPSDSMSMKEPRYSDPTNWHDMSGLSAPFHEQRSSITVDYRTPNNQLPEAYTMQHRMQQNHDFHTLGQLGDTTQSIGVNDLSQDGIQGPFQSLSGPSLHRRHNLHEEGGYPPIPAGSNVGPTQASGVFGAPPPLPSSPPPPVPLAPPRHQYSETHASSSPPKASSLFPIPVSSPADVPSSHPPVPEAYSLTQTYYSSKPRLHASTGFSTEEFQARQTLSKRYLGDNQPFPLRHLSSDKPKVVDASHIFKQPHRATRPDRIVIILRGLPGSGKSYLAKMLRDLEVEYGGDAPRIHSMDDYFMTEVEKFEEGEASKSSGSVRAKKPVMKKVMEYCYEPEMEEAYRSSMLKAFKKTLDEGVFSFIIVDDRNLRVADFAQFWATAKRSGYEVYLLEATYKDPAGCAARNVHGFTQDDIQQMAGQWEEAPSLYLKLDIKPLLHGDGLEESGIQEVDMDTEDVDPSRGLSGSEDRNPENVTVPLIEGFAPNDPSKDDKRWYAEKGQPTEEVKELRRSKWSDDLDEDDAQRTEDIRGNSSALSGLIQAYSKEGKSVRWGDQVGNTGFSIGAAKRENILSLVIGPGSGYNLKSNPLPEEENLTPARYISESKRQNMFQEHMRAERESFKAVFDKRRHRIGGLNVEED